jgi:hypothetical protein
MTYIIIVEFLHKNRVQIHLNFIHPSKWLTMKAPWIGDLNANTTRTIIVLNFPSKKKLRYKFLE